MVLSFNALVFLCLFLSQEMGCPSRRITKLDEIKWEKGRNEKTFVVEIDRQPALVSSAGGRRKGIQCSFFLN